MIVTLDTKLFKKLKLYIDFKINKEVDKRNYPVGKRMSEIINIKKNYSSKQN